MEKTKGFNWESNFSGLVMFKIKTRCIVSKTISETISPKNIKELEFSLKWSIEMKIIDMKIKKQWYSFDLKLPSFTTIVFFSDFSSFSTSLMLLRFKTPTLNKPIEHAG